MSQAVGTIAAIETERATRRPRSAVRWWLWTLALLVMVMVAVGGATRLTGSGLSITEWKPVTGAVPPLTEAGWVAEFEKYRASSQYRNLNRGMEMPEFKTIYWWEWSHRQLGRFIGLFFFLPLGWFWLRGALTGRRAAALLGIGLLGGLQATVGWIMVASGLEPGMTAVAPLKLMLHLLIAALILALIVRMIAGLDVSREPEVPGRVATGAALLVGLVLLQIALGGLVAGSRAGWTYNTWPLMDGRLVPDPRALFSGTPWIENFVDNPLLVQLNHRITAYLLLGVALWHAYAARVHPQAGRRAGIIAALVLAQAILGVATLLLVVPLWAGLSHQLLAMAILMVAVYHARRVRLAVGPPASRA